MALQPRLLQPLPDLNGLIAPGSVARIDVLRAQVLLVNHKEREIISIAHLAHLEVFCYKDLFCERVWIKLAALLDAAKVIMASFSRVLIGGREWLNSRYLYPRSYLPLPEVWGGEGFWDINRSLMPGESPLWNVLRCLLAVGRWNSLWHVQGRLLGRQNYIEEGFRWIISM